MQLGNYNVPYLIKEKFQILSVTADKGSKVILADQAFNIFSISDILHFNLPRDMTENIIVKNKLHQNKDKL